MKQLKYLIRLQDGTEKRFESNQAVADFLEVSLNTIHSLKSGRLQKKHSSKKKLENIVIEKIPVYYPAKPSIQKVEETTEEYQARLKLKT